MSPIPPIHRYAGRRWDPARRERGGACGAFQSEVEGAGLAAGTYAVSVVTAQPPVHIAVALRIAISGQVVIRKRHMHARRPTAPEPGVLVQVATSYIPASIAAGTAIEQRDTGRGGIMSPSRRTRPRAADFTETIYVRPPELLEAAAFSLDPEERGARVVDIIHIDTDAAGTPVLVTEHVLNPEHWVLHYSGRIAASQLNRSSRSRSASRQASA